MNVVALLHLPDAAVRIVSDQFDFIALIAFSFCSDKCKQIVKSKNMHSRALKLVFDGNVQLRFCHGNVKVNVLFDYEDWIPPQDRLNSYVISGPIMISLAGNREMIEDMEVVRVNSMSQEKVNTDEEEEEEEEEEENGNEDEYELSFSWELKKVMFPTKGRRDFSTVTNHFLDILNLEAVTDIFLDTARDFENFFCLEPLIDTLKQVRINCDYLYVGNFVHQKMIEDALRALQSQLPKKLEFNNRLLRRTSRNRIFIQNFDELNSFIPNYANPVADQHQICYCLDDLLLINSCKIVTLTSLTDANKFIKCWQRGSNRRLVWASIALKEGPVFEAKALLKGICYQEIKRNVCGEEMTVYKITNSKGNIKASVYLTGEKFFHLKISN